MPLILQELSRQLGLRYTGNANLNISGVASISNAQSGDLCFLTNSKNKEDAVRSACSAVIVPEDFDSESIDIAFIYSNNPQLSFIQAIELISPDRLAKAPKGIHPSAQISDTASIGEGVSIGALCVIGENSIIGVGSQIGASCVLEDNVQVGGQSRLHSRVTLGSRVQLGDRCQLHSGVVIGSDGFGLLEVDNEWHKVPQIGTVIIGNDVEIGANTTVDRGALDDTIIEEGCKLDNLIQVAHNVRIGAHTAIAACVGIAGSANIGRHCKISGGVGVLGHLSICDHVTVTAMSLVTRDIKKPGVYSSGTPLLENSDWHKCNVRYKSLDKFAKTLNRLDKQSR